MTDPALRRGALVGLAISAVMMRTFLNLQKLMGLLVMTPVATGLGAGLGALGGRLVRRRSLAR